jgi:hypothetical protein
MWSEPQPFVPVPDETEELVLFVVTPVPAGPSTTTLPPQAARKRRKKEARFTPEQLDEVLGALDDEHLAMRPRYQKRLRPLTTRSGPTAGLVRRHVRGAARGGEIAGAAVGGEVALERQRSAEAHPLDERGAGVRAVVGGVDRAPGEEGGRAGGGEGAPARSVTARQPWMKSDPEELQAGSARAKRGRRQRGAMVASRLAHPSAAQYLRTARGASSVPSISRNGLPGAPLGNAKLPVFA